jgi:large subunit ribosomal protein L13
LNDFGGIANLLSFLYFETSPPGLGHRTVRGDLARSATVSKSFLAKKETVQPEWYVVDADNQIVGRLATQLATVLMGKHKPTYTPHVDTGDFVIVINADKVRFSGQLLAHESHPYFTKKMLTRTYERYTGYPSGQRTQSAADLLARRPEMILREAVRRMLPKNKLASRMLKKLKLYAGPTHPHQAQVPREFPSYLMT